MLVLSERLEVNDGDEMTEYWETHSFNPGSGGCEMESFVQCADILYN